MPSDEDLIGVPLADDITDGLTLRQARFVWHYGQGNKTQKEAALLAGFSHPHSGYDSLLNPKVQRALRKVQADYRDQVKATLDQVISEYAKIAFFDPKALFDDQGNPRPINEIDDLTAAAIAGVEVTTDDVGGNIRTKTTKYKISDKRAALADLLKVMGISEKIELKGNVKHSLEIEFVKP